MAPTTDHAAGRRQQQRPRRQEEETPDVDMEMEEEEEEEGGEDDGFIRFFDSGDEEERNPPGNGEEDEQLQGLQQQGGEGEGVDAMVRPYFEVPWYRAHHLQQQQGQQKQQKGKQHAQHQAAYPRLPPLLRLHNELLDFCDLLAPTRAELQDRQRVAKIAADTVKALWPHFDVQVFGSEATKVFLPDSDIDMVVLPPQELPVHQVRSNLYKLADTFKGEAAVTAMEVIAKARVPIIKLRFHNLQVDISFSSDSGLKSARYMLERMEALPPLRPLILVLKYFLAQRELNETFLGGAGSFLLQLMLISFLQHQRKEAEQDGAHCTWNLGSLFLGFLRLYGVDFNYEETGISVLSEGIYFRKMERGMFVYDRPFLIAIENPLDTAADVGRNSYNMPAIRAAFAQAYARLHNAILHPTPHAPPVSLLSAAIRPDEALSARPMPKRSIFMTRVFTPREPYPQLAAILGGGAMGGGHSQPPPRRGGRGDGDREMRLGSVESIGSSNGSSSNKGGKKRGRWSGGQREDALDMPAVRGDDGRRGDASKRGRRR